MKKSKKQPEMAEEWDLREGMGILPQDISLTQNIGCVSSKKGKAENSIDKSTGKK